MLKSLVLALVLAIAPALAPALASAQPARPQPLAADDARAVRAVVEAQLKAFADDRAAQAFAHAAPAIQAQFGDAAQFMAMVRRSYPMLFKPASVAFMQPEAADGIVLQGVRFRDREGRLWQAAYQLERQPDKRWRINGCAVAPAEEGSTT